MKKTINGTVQAFRTATKNDKDYAVLVVAYIDEKFEGKVAQEVFTYIDDKSTVKIGAPVSFELSHYKSSADGSWRQFIENVKIG